MNRIVITISGVEAGALTAAAALTGERLVRAGAFVRLPNNISTVPQDQPRSLIAGKEVVIQVLPLAAPITNEE